MGYVYLAVPLSGIVLFICEIKNSMDDIYGTQGVDESVKGGE
jgi:TRAP-type C4-dicarboxylate transport system permease small subunit